MHIYIIVFKGCIKNYTLTFRRFRQFTFRKTIYVRFHRS